MKWLGIRIKTTTEAEDLIIGSLYLRGLEGAQIEDHIPLSPLEKEQMFVDIPPETGEDDGTAYLTFYLECVDDNNPDVQEIRAIIDEELDQLQYYDIDAGELSVEIFETEDIDWINNWKKYFHQFTIDDLLVIPSWEEVSDEDAGKMILHIDPGTAFGTGMHETTQLCIRQMRKYITSDTRLLDIGTGSGILGILALMYGAASVTATDLDPCAVPAVEDNLKNNGVDSSKFELMIGNIIDDRSVQDKVGYERYDIVMANILADVLIPMMPAASKALRPGGVIVTSGIIEGKEDSVSEAMKAAGLEVIDISEQGEWRSVTGRK
ncbi:MAG: 50S ribosomal protein L11 methyltransferase [Lachnospiraceae bacterium]|nr:50S ribosomal protein L11 methyltransferase [Lachnospiraceae bacterium]